MWPFKGMCDESSWPDVDQNTVCGDCKVICFLFVVVFWSLYSLEELFLVKSKGKIISCGTLRNHPPGSGDSHEQRLPQLLELLLLHGTHLHRGLGGGPWLLWDSLYWGLRPRFWKLYQRCYLRVWQRDLIVSWKEITLKFYHGVSQSVKRQVLRK